MRSLNKVALITSLAPGQAHFVLDKLVREGAVRPQQVERHVRAIPGEIAEMEARLFALQGGPSRGTRRPSRPGLRRPSNPAVQASRELQGRYMGLLRHAAPSIKARAQALCKRMGRERAVEFLLDHQH